MIIAIYDIKYNKLKNTNYYIELLRNIILTYISYNINIHVPKIIRRYATIYNISNT